MWFKIAGTVLLVLGAILLLTGLILQIAKTSR
jgi:hypothetical protein